jgi:hypothetical protein
MLYSLCSTAQTGNTIPVNEPNYNKAKLFQDLPEKIQVSIDNLSSLFSEQVGRSVSLNLSGDESFRFNGDVVSIVSKYENTIQSVVVRSTNYNGARLTLTKSIDANGNISYKGRIISIQHGDLYELKSVNNDFLLEKRKFHDIVNE